MKAEVNIACVFWKGDFRGRDFCTQDVWHLYHSILKHIDRPFEFFVFTNQPSADLPGTVIELKHSKEWVGWWSKMELFRPGILPKRRTLYQDLDSFIIRGLSPILDFEGDLVMWATPEAVKMKWIIKNGNTPAPLYRNSTMLFTPGEFTWLYEKFLQGYDYYINNVRGDQELISMWLPNQPTFNSEWLLKLGTMELNPGYLQNPPQEAIIITGQPRSGLFRDMGRFPWFKEMA